MTRLEIGSDFEAGAWELWPGDGIDLGASVPVMSGRQALEIVASEMERDGIHVCLFPDHYCASMVAPFLAHGIDLIEVPCDANLLMAPEALQLATESVDAPFGVLHCDTLGSVADEELGACLRDLSARGSSVVVDATHSFLGGATQSPKYVVVSLRKLLGLPDGAYVWGLSRPPELAPTAEGAVRRRIDGATAKQKYLDGVQCEPTHLESFARSERDFDQLTEPRAMSSVSLEILAGMDVGRIAERRRENYRLVTSGLIDIGYSVLGSSAQAGRSAAFAVIRSPHAGALQKRAAESGIFCPIHWPAPREREQGWRRDLLSVPVDQRYAESDMHRIIEIFADLYKESLS